MTDTNQASEEVRTKLALILGYERQEQHSSEKTRWYDLDEYGNPIEVTKKVDKVIDLIRTEKLKLLAEVRERVIEQAKPDKRKATSWQQGIEVAAYEDAVRVYEYKMNEQLTKLEAEL